MARCTSAAATEESTPPDRPQMTRPSPACFAVMRRDRLFDEGLHRPAELAQPQMPVHEVAQAISAAALGVHDLRVELHAPDRVLVRMTHGGEG